MRVYITHPHGRTRWGVFTNLWPTNTSKRDRKAAGAYLHIHTPWRVMEVYP